VRGDGEFVVLDGKWLQDRSPVDLPLAAAPAWLERRDEPWEEQPYLTMTLSNWDDTIACALCAAPVSTVSVRGRSVLQAICDDCQDGGGLERGPTSYLLDEVASIFARGDQLR
jgi:hypothetical protein